LCGRCGRQLATGDPIFVFTINRGDRRSGLRRIRCDQCEGPAPPDLAPWVPGSTIGFNSPRPTLKSWAEMEELARSNEREPGEEG
jgi:hypothetical protein